ncbi:MAG: VOC family protein [Saprospiraceae bacterium]|nr:VOC family protein [Saprospiraceae bacterium]
MLEQILGPITPFLDQIFQHLTEDNILVNNYELDHICYRVANEERYLELKHQLADHGELLTESIIGGRLISTFKLHQPYRYQNREIQCLELPAPKEGSPYPEGFEHAEFVIQESFEVFMSKYSHLTFKTKGIQKPVNPEISLKYTDLSVKFHHHPIEYVIKYLD